MGTTGMNRRTFLAAASSAALLAACGKQARAEPPKPMAVIPGIAMDQPAPEAAQPHPAPPAPTPTPVRPAASYERTLLAGTPWATAVSIRDSGTAGPAVLVLGGVHGNEPGGWMAAEEVANWAPRTGSLIVVPRANRLATHSFVRTFDDIGDLNRLYPGDAASSFAMERMAAEITALANEFECALALDMHESWAFYVDAPGTGTAALGQTITTGVGPLAPAFGPSIAEALNGSLPEHDRFVVRDGTSFRRPDTTGGTTARGRSSLSLGGHVAGLTPVLVEMGQQNQDVDRRMALHLMVARQALGMLGVL